VSGFFYTIDPGSCGVATPVSANFQIFQVVDEENDYDNPIVCNGQGLAHACRTMPGDPPPVGNFGGGLFVCASDTTDAQNQLSAFWSDKAVTPLPYPPDNLLDFSHSNTGGMFSYYFPDPTGSTVVTLVFKALQIAGQIPQPRKLSVFNYAGLIAQFSNPAAAADWNGQFLTRDNFDSTKVNWIAPAGGNFGGAKVEWFNGHPTSANGFGWKITLYDKFLIPFYVAIKGIDATSEGRYYRDASSPAGPDCLVIDDASSTIWYPGTHP
jgi:hypothetical protein